jgi:hypothetical protein
VGIAAALVTVGAVAWLAVAALLDDSPLPRPGPALLPLTAAALVLVAVKLVTDVDRLAAGAWLSVALAVTLLGFQVADRRVLRSG